MSLYRAYGLDIESDRALPLRPSPAGAEPDLAIVYSDRAPAAAPSGPDRRALTKTGLGWTLRYDNEEGGWMAFDYSAPERRLLVSGNVDREAFEGPLSGLVWGVLQRLEGATLLHAACVGWGRHRAIAILGASGHGKSTLAGALVAQGATSLTEDLLLLRSDPEGFVPELGAPTLNLLADAYEHLAPHLGAASARPSGDDKIRLMLGAEAVSARLSAIYILAPPGPGGEPSLERLFGASAIGALAEHLYGSRWIRPAGSDDLAFCALLTRDIPVFVLSRPWTLESVLDTAARVRSHALSP